MSANAAAVVIRCKHVVGTDGDEAGVTDLHLAVKLDQTLGLALVPRTESSPAKHQDHGISPLQVRKLATFARVVGQLIIGKYRTSYNVRSHRISSERLGIMNCVFWVPIISAHRFQSYAAESLWFA